MSQPNPTTPAVDVAEGRRLWENAKAALAAEKAYEISNVQCYETVALYQAWAFDNAEALLRAASERDAAVREVERLRAGLRELAEPPGPHADEIAWNMAERAEQILASAAQKQAKPALTIEDSSGGANG